MLICVWADYWSLRSRSRSLRSALTETDTKAVATDRQYCNDCEEETLHMARDDVHGAETLLGTELEENVEDPGSRLPQTIDVLDQWGHFKF
ncbi:hypothetical protein ATJ93_4768 [Halopiger aswanensis]|uniref:Uncharacterized protein n=1 Tax=Halopiger aswanensis TaxID=148449 RepID=A0A419VUU5_9EURY|nr:hypothetical protein ATJ93_4768 [Halopiger aswanensis]